MPLLSVRSTSFKWSNDIFPIIFSLVEQLIKIAGLSHLIDEWHYEKNGRLKPEEITPNKNLKIWWKCKERHSWQATILDTLTMICK